FGKRSGSYSFNQLDDTSVLEAVKKAEKLARLAPEDAEYMPPLEAQHYPMVNAFAESTARVTPEFRAAIAADCIKLSERKKLIAAGFIDDSSSFSMFA